MLKFIPLLTAAILALPVPLLAQDAGAVLRIIEAQDQIVRIQAKTRHTTVIVLPAAEDILDFVVGDSEYWHLTGAANLAFLKPIAEGVTTNVALVCASGRIYSFLVTEESAGEPHLIVRVEHPQIDDPRISPGVNTPAFVRRSQVTAYQEMAETAMQTVATVQEEAEVRVAEAKAQAQGETDARLDDGSRVAICVPPASPQVAITVRRFGKRSFSADDLVKLGSLPETVKKEAERVLRSRRNILVSGGTGSGKTTLLNALIELLPDDERIVAIEDTLELRIERSNCVRFEARGLQEGAVTIRDLVRHALRHRPDHIVVGEVRGGEAADLLQALNTGHGGSLTTVHANNAESALSRIASCAMQGGGELPWEVTCRGVVDGIAMVIHMTRHEGRRFVEEAVFVKGYEAGENRWAIQPVWPPEATEPPGESSRPGRGS